MKRVYANSSLINVGHVRNLLEHDGIRCTIKNEQLGAALGEIPFLDCQPEVWVLDEADANRAQAVIRDALQGDVPRGSPWRCTRCGETNEPQFAACFSCGGADSTSP